MREDEGTELQPRAPAAEHAFSEVLSFEDFFELEHERLLGALYLVTGNRQDAEDLMQEAFVKVLQKWDLVQSLTSPTGYLYRTAMNTFRSGYQRVRLAARRLRRPAGRLDPFDDVELRADIRVALAGLTPRQRAAIVLTELLDYPPSEAGRALGIKGSTVRALTTQGRASLRNALGGRDE